MLNHNQFRKWGNDTFELIFDSYQGTITSMVLADDPHKMNFVGEIGNWGRIHCRNRLTSFSYKQHKSDLVRQMELVSFRMTEDRVVSVYSNMALSVTVSRFFNAQGHLCETYTVKNLREFDYYSEYGNFAIEIPFNDRYTYAEDCMDHRCHTHLWCGHTSTYVNALKMGESEHNLGLTVTRGSFGSYSVREVRTNVRGIFTLNADHFALLPEEEYTIEWEIFPHTGVEDFYKKLETNPSYVKLLAEHYTVLEGEEICFEATLNAESPEITLDGCCVPFEQEDGVLRVRYKPRRLGAHRFDICGEGVRTYAEFFVSEALDTVIEKRIDYVIRHQQCDRRESPLYGAYLIYDTAAKHPYYDEIIGDHNACRERVGMGLMIARYLQKHRDARMMASLERYVDFVKRGFYEESTGEVFNNLGKDRSILRLYNAPWITTLLTELYYLTGKREHLLGVLRILEGYYAGGGARFYPNGLSPYRTLKAFDHAGMREEGARVLALFEAHTENMMRNGGAYPKHEVNYEQTIVTPAATFISEMGIYTGKEKYKEGARAHLTRLERFGGKQPSFHLHHMPIRFWDGYWFGKKRLWGDVFPHYWSCLSARSFLAYGRLTEDARYRRMAEENLRNCLCLFRSDGGGSCAYMYPHTCNGVDGEFYDSWANDQDFALYFAMVSELLDETER